MLGLASAKDPNLLGVCDYESALDYCKVNTSLEGGRPFQIRGTKFSGTAQDQTIYFQGDVTSVGPAMTSAYNFNSDISRGIIYYETPSIKTLLGTAAAKLISVYDPNLFVKSPPDSQGVEEVINCDVATNWGIHYDVAYTPQISRVYPSTVYSGMDICFNVFTDLASSGGKQVLKTAKIGEYTVELDTYSEANLASISTWNNYQLWGTAGGNVATKSYDLTVTADVGKYLVTNFAKSYDGTSTYTVRSVAKISKVSTNTLYKAGGSILTISGEGFDPVIANNAVKVDDLTCTVFEASTTELKCVLPEKTTTTSATVFAGGLGANVKEYDNVAKASVTSSTTPSRTTHFTDIEARRDTNVDGSFTRVVETWFVPPQTGSYIFHASCDDQWEVYLSTTDMDKSAPTLILTANLNGWRNFWSPATSIASASQSLTAGKHYYMKVVHSEYGGSDYMTVGFTIDDASTAHPNSERGWKRLTINPHHTYETYVVTIPNNASPSFRIQFKGTDTACNGISAMADIFACTSKTCSCVSDSFKSTSTESQFKSAIDSNLNKVKSYYGTTAVIIKEGLDIAGAVTTTTADIVSYRFTITTKMVLSAPSTTEVKIYSSDSTVTGATVAKTTDSTVPMTGSYKLRIPVSSDGTTKDTEDASLSLYDGGITRIIYKVAPELIGRLEVRVDTSRYPTPTEGKDLFYRIDGTWYGNIQILSSTTTPITGGSTTQAITFETTDVVAASNKPFYEVIPGTMTRTVETSAQVIVTTNSLVSACPTASSCNIAFIDNVGEITSRTAASPYTLMTFAGTSIPSSELTFVSVGTLRRWELDSATAATATSVKCNLLKPIAGSHSVVVQSKKGAIKNGASITNLVIPIQINSVSPSSLGTSGGQNLKITGNFFPQSLTEAKSFADFAITFTGGAKCAATSVSQTEIQCTTPAGLSGTPKVTVTFNSQTLEYATAFSLNPPTGSVVSVDKTAVSPVEKQNLVITLSKTPSSTPADYTGVIISEDYTIKMKVNSVDTSAKTITARFPGSPKSATFTVYVDVQGERYSSTVTLNALAKVTGVQITTTSSTTKTSISTSGGDTVKLTGTGFSTTLTDNVIVVGNAKGEIVSATVTELVFRAPGAATAASATITAFLKPNIEMECTVSGGCTLTYDSSQAPTTSSTGDLTAVDGVVTISGSNFGANAKGFIGSYEQQTVSSTSSEVKIKLTKMDDNEKFSLVVRTDSVNLPSLNVAKPLTQALLDVSPQTGSSGGEKITLSTVGLGLKTTSGLDVSYGTGASAVSICQSIKLVDSSTVTCVTKNDLAITKTALKLTFTHFSSVTGKSTVVTLQCATATNCEYETTAAATPTVTSISKANNKLTVNFNNFSLDSSYTVKLYYGKAVASSDSISAGSTTGTFTKMFTPGVAPVRVSFEKNNRLTFSSKYDETVALSATIASTISCSWAGGCNIELNQAGLTTGAEAGDVSVEVCGKASTFRLSDSTANKLIAWAPSYVNTHSLETYFVEQPTKIYGTVTSVPVDEGLKAFDGVTNVMYKSTSDNNWYVQVMFPAGKVGRLQKVRYFMNRMTDKMTNFFEKLTFQSSTDGTTWTDVFKADVNLREGWNDKSFSTALKTQYYRFFSATKEACQIGEIELIGNIVEDSSATSKTCDIIVKTLGGQTQTFASKLTYADSASSVVTKITPRYGTYKGGETITFTGTGFSTTTSEAKILIDGVACTVSSATSTEVKCVTGARATVQSTPTTILTFVGSSKNGHASMQKHSFKYANYWTDLDTWSGEYIPQAGDSVVIPAGQTLVFDADSSPVLKAIIVQGALVFIPSTDATHHRKFDAEYIYVDKGGVFEVGTEDERYTSKITITMHGTRESPQIPVYGNKGIFVRFAQFDMHGVVRDSTWTELATTVNAGADILPLNRKVDWKAGEKIVLAPTDFNLDHAEEFEILSVDNSGTKTILKVDRPATYKHYSGVTSFTGSNGVNADMTKTLEMRAEVGLLTRNVVFKGADDDSVERQYGAHIMLHSPGDESLTGRISYVELTQVGQAFQLGRYPIHFHMIGTVHNSYIKGNAIHHTYNRACTIHGVHYLTLQDNVAYETMGHTFFIEDAIETKNLLQNNLAVKTKRSWSLLNTDQTPASFWITNPDNQFIGNHAAGSDRYGFWFDLQTHPTGPSFDPNICPEYGHLGEFTGNVAHSNGRYGLRLFHRFTPVSNPCAALAGGKFNDREQPDPIVNVPEVTHFRNFLAYKNMRTGVIAEELGAVKFHNIRTADNVISGVEFGITAAGPWLTSSDDYHLQDALIVGASENIDSEILTFEESGDTCGVKGARTEKMRIKDTIFANFNYDSKWGAISTWSHCEGPATDSSGRTYFMKNLYFVNSSKRVRFDIPFKEIIYDEDGTLGNSTHRWIVFYQNHLDVPECVRNEATYNGLLCNKDISIRRIVIDHPQPSNALDNLPLKVLNLNKIQASRRNLVDVSPTTCPATSSALTALNTIDSTSIGLQNSLLLQYDYYTKNKTAYNEAVKLFESTGDTSQQAQISTYQAAFTAAEAQIATLKPQVESYYGKYDLLYTTDKNVCNVNNYQVVDFRGKANPKKNWVFNVISGYEYKIHTAQGADFTSLPFQYSYKELLNGETKGVIIHFNHTEKTEAFIPIYTDSTGKAVEIVPKTANLQLSDSTLKMGDFHLNNVTRHMMMKFDGTDAERIRFTLTREKCITVGGCGGTLPSEGEIETTPRYWSKVASWTKTGKIPVAGDDVVIDSTWNMILDVPDLPVFRSIEINGRLTVKNDGGTYNIRSYLIYVRKGEMIVGTAEEPIKGKVIFTLYGTRAEQTVYFNNKMFEAGNKVIANTGKLLMYGKPVGLKWTRLATKAAVGATTIDLVDTPTDWAVGDELGINPSGRDYTHRDFAVIKAISGKTITLETPLQYEHFGAATLNATKSGAIDIRAEVVHLTRNIKVQGTNEDKWGGHIVTSHNVDTGFVDGKLVSIPRKGYALIDHVEFLNCSQYDTDKAAVRFANFNSLTSTDTKSSLTNSAIHNGLGIGVMVTSADDVTIDNNVVFFTHVGGIWMKKSHNTKITNNVVGGMGTRYWSGETRLDEIAGYNLCNHDQNCKNLIVKNNIMGGFERIGFALPTVDCSKLSNYENNLAHTVQHGAFVLKNNLLAGKECFANFKAYKTMEQGVLTYQNYKAISVSNVETLDCGRGVTIMIGKSDDSNPIEIKDVTIWGESDLLPKDAGSMCIDIYGFWLSASSIGGKKFPESMLSALPYEKIKSYANWNTEVSVTNIQFKNWKSATRQSWTTASTNAQKVFFINPNNPDHVPVNRITNAEFIDVHNDALVQFDPPNPAWAIIRDCGQWPCTAPENAVIKFKSTKASGNLVPAITGISASAGATFQIIANNPKAADFMSGCTKVASWNAYLCYNEKIAQIMFESLDDDKEDRMFSPINILGQGNNFNNTLNTFMDHCWDGHYTCQKRLSRFPAMLETQKSYEIYFTGTQPGKTRYMLEGADDGDWLIVKIDFSKSILFYVYADGVKVESNRYDGTAKKIPQLTKSKCGENRFEQITYTYEFYLTKGCVVQIEAQDHLIGLVRLQMSLDQFFEEDFVSKLAFALGITTDRIRVVGTQVGSVIVNFYITSSESSSTTRTAQLRSLNDQLASKYANGQLNLGYPILDLVTSIVSSSGSTITTGTGTYTKKEIHVSVYILLALSAVAVVIGFIFGLVKAIKTSRAYKKLANSDPVEYMKGEVNQLGPEGTIEFRNEVRSF